MLAALYIRMVWDTWEGIGREEAGFLLSLLPEALELVDTASFFSYRNCALLCVLR